MKDDTAPTLQDSLSIAFSKLLERFGFSKIETFDTTDGWHAITRHEQDIEVDEIGYLSWPNSNDAIVKFQVQSEEAPYIDVDGFQRSNIIEVYYLVDDTHQHTIVDHVDGGVKPSFLTPVSWASYKTLEDPKGNPTNKKECLYTWVLYDNIWEVARRLGFDAKELMEHNSITDPALIEPGTVLHLPSARKLDIPRPVRYELFDKPVAMHISHEHGTHKLAFGNVTKWSDLMPSGYLHKYLENVMIEGVAHVPIGEETAAFYVDAWALGDYRNTGEVAHTVGFNHSHLAEGLVEQEEKAPIITERLMEAAEEALQNLDDFDEPEPVDVEELEPDPNMWKTSYKDFPEGHRRYLLRKDLTIYDLDDRHPPRRRSYTDEIITTGTFIGPDGIVYERPPRSSTSYHWYGIPPDMLEPEAEVYNTDLELYEKVAARLPLSLSERTFEVFARNVTEFRRLRIGYDKFKHKK